MRAARTGIPEGHNHASRKLPFDVQVELLNHALFEIQVLRLNGSSESSRVRLCGKAREEGALQAAIERRCRSGILEWAQT